MKKRTAWVLIAGVAAVAIGAAGVGALALVLRGSKGGSWTADNYLYLRLEGEVPEQPPSDFGSFLEKRPASLRTLMESLDRAATDPKVRAVVVRVSVLPDSGWGKVQELRDAITRFRKSGKPAYAHLEISGNKEYYLATACTKIYAVPSALLDVTGLHSEVMFFRNTLDKLGVEAQFEGVGKYKNAPNQFTETGFTEAHREQMEALLDSIYAQYIAAIASARGKTADEVQAIVDAGPYEGRDALQAGLVDELLYEDQIEERLKAEKITPGRYVRAASGFGIDGRPKVALVYAVGDIAPGESQNGPLGSEMAGSDTVAGALRDARKDESIKAIVLRVDSPGGSGTASDVIWREVALARRSKPVVVSMGDVAASGGYYISMSSDAIVAQPATITGSIGVFGGKFSIHGLYDKIGITKEILTRGQHSAMFSEYRPWTDEERDRIRTLMVSFYRDFVGKVAQGRKQSYEDIDAVAQGRVWTGSDALQHGLVDRLGGMDVALAVAKEKAKIGREQEVNLVVLPERKGFLDLLLERQEEGALEAVPSDARALLRWVRLLGDSQILARLPFDLKIR
jgi:protease-4